MSERLRASRERFEAWLFAAGSAERLAALRIGLCLLLAARLSRPLFLDLSGQPEALFRPISFTRLLESMPPRPVVLSIQVVGVAAALLAAVGIRARLALPLAFVALVFLGGMSTSLGKVVHNDLLLLWAIVPLLGAPVADAWAPGAPRARPPSPRYGWPVRTSMLLVALAYFFSGFAKVLNSGIDWVVTGNLRWILYASSDTQPEPNALALFVADRAWLAYLLAAGTIVIECAFPLVLWRRRLAWLLVPAVLALHLGIWLAMRLDYWPWILTVLIVFIDWPALMTRARRPAPAMDWLI